jgi:CDP-diacylglycerol--serine O-phosphatidyltransferase
MGTVGLLISFLPLLFGSIRLARFNTQLKGFSKDYFKGLPIPVAALTLTSFIIFSQHFFDVPVQHPQILLLLVFIVSILMVSNVRYEIMPNLTLKGSKIDRVKLILIFLGAILVIYSPQMLLFPLIIIYILSGPLRWIYSFLSAEEAKSESKN